MPLHLPKVRSDLEYFDQEVEGEEVIMVRDPVRGTYFKYNPLQAAMLRSLDGVRSLDEMVAALSEQFEVEIPRIAAERFVVHARKQMLLDVASYAVPEAKAAKKVLQTLRQQGFRFRGPGREEAVDDVTSAEGALFLGGIRQLHAGHPSKALDYFCAVLELNPGNQRAKTLVDAIHTAYVKALSGSTSDFPTFVLFNPTRLLKFLDRTVGKLVFHWLAWFALAGLIVLAIYCCAITPYPDLDVSATDIVLAIILTTAHFFLHELAHGWACYHYGGAVPEIGIIFFYYVRPVPYCDTSSSYLFRDRRQQVGVQMAGAILSVIFCCLLFVVLALIHPHLFIYQAGQLILWISVILTFVDLIPFAKFDGYYALCDYLGIPNLRERSIKLLKGWAGARLFGMPVAEEPLTPGKRRMFFAFAICSLAFTGLWIYHVVFQLLAPTVEKFRGIGLVLAIAVLAYLLRGTLFYPVGRLLIFAVRERRRIFTPRRGSLILVVVAALVLPWLIRMPVTVDADFVLVPKQRVEIRAQTPGRIEQILIREGDAVTAGQAIAVLRNDDVELELRVVAAELEKADAQLAALRSGARPEA
ncbi:MAG: biotin/lipoyl-binding protein, partial [Myxococcales bacterium]|nr:biotin/lipoyl-binding protein [Myxococcales bacterium]